MKYFRVGNLTITNQLLNSNSFCLLNGKTQFTTETYGVIVPLFTKILCFQKKMGRLSNTPTNAAFRYFKETGC